MKPGLPWHPWRKQLIEAFECYAFAKQFGWSDQSIQKLKEEEPYKYQMYSSMMNGFGKSETKKT